MVKQAIAEKKWQQRTEELQRLIKELNNVSPEQLTSDAELKLLHSILN